MPPDITWWAPVFRWCGTASGWNAPIDHLARFLGFLAGGSAASGPGRPEERVLARRTLEEMWRPVAQTGAALPEYTAVGLVSS